MPYARVNGLFLHYAEDCDVPPWRTPPVVVLHHGALRTSGMWYGWLPALTPHFRVIRLDARGHGESQAPPPDYAWQVEKLAADVAGLLQALGVERAHYIGESLGGVIGSVFATEYPERLNRLVLCATPTRVREGAAQLRALGYADWDSAIRALGVRGWYLAYREKTGDLHPDDPGRDEWFAAEAARSQSHVITRLTAMTAQMDITDRLPRIQAPTLVLAPSRSPLSASPEQQRALAAAIPKSRLAIVDGPGHHIYLDRAEECARLASDFLRAPSS